MAKKMSDGRRLKELYAFIDLCFSCLEDISVKQVAVRTELCVSTIYRLQRKEFTLAVHFGTIQSLGSAAGLKLELTKTKARVRLVA